MTLILSIARRAPWALLVLDALLTLVCIVLFSAIVGEGLWGLGIKDRRNVGLLAISLVLLRTALSADPVPVWWRKPLARLSALAQARSRTMLAVGTTAFAVLHATRAWMRHASFGSNAYDLGFIDQAVWATANGVGFMTSSLSRGGTYLGEHFSPILTLFVPFYWVAETPVVLFVAHALLLASAGPLFYAVARRLELSRPIAMGMAVAAWLYWPARASLTFDFREDAFFVALVPAAVLAVLMKRPVLAALAFLLLLAVKENAAIPVFFLGAWLAVRGRRAVGAGVMFAALAWFVVLNAKVMPLFNGGGTGTLVDRFGELGGDNQTILRTLLSRPFFSLRALFGPMMDKTTLNYLLLVLGPLAMLVWPGLWAAPRGRFRVNAPLLVWVGACLSLVALNVGAINPPRALGYHYECIVAPFVLLALVAALSRAVERFGEGGALTLLLVPVFALSTSALVSDLKNMVPTSEHRCIEAALQAIPVEHSVAAQSSLHPHVDHRAEATYFTTAERTTSDVVAVALNVPLSRFGSLNLDQDIPALLDSGRYALWFDHPSVQLLCRSELCASLPPLAPAACAR